jgi:hypothetical protein
MRIYAIFLLAQMFLKKIIFFKKKESLFLACRAPLVLDPFDVMSQ